MSQRVLTISGLSSYNYKPVPAIRLQGKWLEKLGFGIGKKVAVEQNRGYLVVRLVTEKKA